MNSPVRDATPLAAPPSAPAPAVRMDAADSWDALWTLDDEWHPDPGPHAADPGFPEFLTIF